MDQKLDIFSKKYKYKDKHMLNKMTNNKVVNKVKDKYSKYNKFKQQKVKKVSLISSSEKDITKIENILFIHDEVQDYNKFKTYSNQNTFTIVYNNNSTKEELTEIFQDKLSEISIKRLGLVFHNSGINTGKVFLDNELLFTSDDLTKTDATLYSSNVKCIIELLNNYHIGNIDYLACNTLQQENWKKYYDILEKETNTLVSASNDETGNLQYGGDWILENTNTNIEQIYFNEAIKDYQYTLATSIINTSTTITQSLLEGYTFPVTINGGTIGSPVVITFDENLTIGSNIGTSGYFILGSEYITIEGNDKTVTIEDVSNYPGLIQNGTNSLGASTNITINNIGIISSGNTTLADNGGWLCQSYFGSNISNGTVIIQNCYSNGAISGSQSGGICADSYGGGASGGIFTIQNCYSTGVISGSSSGGICGNGYGTLASGGTFTIQNCYSTGAISGSSSGGICGYAYGVFSSGTFTIQNCYSTGTISGSQSGGICGAFYGGFSSGTFTIQNCYSTGEISGISGGICGLEYGAVASGGTFTVNNCYSLGVIDDSSGGIIGPYSGFDADASTVTIDVNNCYSIGTYNVDNGIFGPDKVIGTQTNCISSNNITWSDSQATSTILVSQPNTWLSFNDNTPWLLLSFNAQIYDPNSLELVYETSGNSNAGLFTPNYQYSIINNPDSKISIASSTGILTFPNTLQVNTYIINVLVGKLNNNIYNSYNYNRFTLTVIQCQKEEQTIVFRSIPATTLITDVVSYITLNKYSSANLPIKYESSNIFVATTTNNTLNVIGAGTSIITASQTGNNCFYPANNVQQTLNAINPAATYQNLYDKNYNQTYNQIYNQIYNQLYNQLYVQLCNAIPDPSCPPLPPPPIKDCYPINYDKLNALTWSNGKFNDLYLNNYNYLYNTLYNTYYDPHYINIYNELYGNLFINLYNELIEDKYDTYTSQDSCSSITLDQNSYVYALYISLKNQLKGQLYTQLYDQLYNQLKNNLPIP